MTQMLHLKFCASFKVSLVFVGEGDIQDVDLIVFFLPPQSFFSDGHKHLKLWLLKKTSPMVSHRDEV